MHSAIIYVSMPESPYDFRELAPRLYAGLQRVEKNPALKQLGEFVWQINFQQDPEVFAHVVLTMKNLGIPYGILQLADAPQWIERKPSRDH
jgi:hypothetical protein